MGKPLKVSLNTNPALDEEMARSLIGQKIKNTIKIPCQRILLIHPMHIPEDNFYLDKALNRRYWAYQPYGCGVLCRDLESRGYITEILDFNYDMLDQADKLRDGFRYSMWKDWFIQKLDSFRPDIIGISCMFTMSHGIMKEISGRAKKYRNNLPVLAGGVHPTNARKLVLQDCPNLDFIGAYECDRSFPDLIDFINGKKSVSDLAQIATLIDGKYVALESRANPQASEIDAAPIYHSLPIGRYSDLGQIGTYGFLWKRESRKAASILTNRGCRAHCSFCSVVTFNGPGVRERSVESVLDEIQELRERHNIRHIELLDDDPLYNKKRALALFNGVVQRNLDITWTASNGLIAAAITEENMQAMAESGCIGFNLGIESGNPEILRRVHKPGTVDSFRKAKVIIDKYPHIFIKGFLIIGFPNETLRQLMDTVNLSLELNFDWYAIQILNPLPSTEIYDEMIALGLAQDKLETSNVAYIFGPHGKQHLREQREKLKAEEFFNLFTASNLEEVPNEDQLKDYWFLIDYKLNYEKILGINDPIKLRKLSLQLADICDRIAPDSAIAQLFDGIIRQKLGNTALTQQRSIKTKELVAESAYWQKRFDALDLHNLLETLI